jgi:hypothetical protein
MARSSKKDLLRRDPRNAPGPFYAVEKLCLACGLPEHEAPDLLAELEKRRNVAGRRKKRQPKAEAK